MHLELILPRKMSAEKEREFEELSRFLEYYSTNYSQIYREDEIHPSNVLVKIVEKYGKSKALQGLKQAINDTIEETKDLDVEIIKKLDEALSLQGIVTLSSLRKQYWSKYKKIVDRGKINNDTEYYLIIGILSSMPAEVGNEERAILDNLVTNYEKNA